MTAQPNIVLFLTDDHGAWANACYGNADLHTPTLDALAESGSRFTHAWTPTPVCSPARACLLTGKTASQVGIHDWLEEALPEVAERDWLGETPTLFQHLSAAGYATGLSGKWHLGGSQRQPKGADYYFGLPGWQGVHNQTYTYVRQGERVELAGNKSAFITDHALEFLDSVPDSKPFFLKVGYIATHSPYHQQAHDPQQTARYQDCPFRDIPPYQPHPWVKNEGTDNAPTEQDLLDRYIGYYAAVTEIDDNIARIIAALKARGQWDNTILIYTSDHGCAMGHQGFFGKGNSTRPLNMYDISLQVPLIIAGAGIERQVLPQYVDHYDTFHTIAELAGLPLSKQEGYAGRSYAPLLRGERISWDNTRYGEYGDLRMIRNERWKLVFRYPAGPRHHEGQGQLVRHTHRAVRHHLHARHRRRDKQVLNIACQPFEVEGDLFVFGSLKHQQVTIDFVVERDHSIAGVQ